jgi:hypothetical protein
MVGHSRKVIVLSVFSVFLASRLAAADKPVWPLTLREGLPATLPGWSAAPSDPLPDEGENDMGKYTEVSRFFQRIEGPASAKQFRIAVQDYGPGKDLKAAIRKAFVEASNAPRIEAREVELGGGKAFVVTDRSGPNPTTLVTVLVAPGRLVLGQGANVGPEEAVGLVRRVDFARIAAAK